MTSERSLDDLPLAAYGGSGMELDAQNEARLDGVAADADAPAAPDPSLDPAAEVAYSPEQEPIPEDEPGAGVNVAAVATVAASRVVTVLRTSRLAAGAVFGLVIVVGLLLLVGSGSQPGAAGAEPSPSAAPLTVATREPGTATLVLTGAIKETLTFTGSAGAVAPGKPLAVTWSDTATNTLGIAGPVDRGTRFTEETLVLQWTIVVDEKPVTFTSTDGECTLGMAVNPWNVSGSFTCKKLKSDDGKHVVGATGTYRT